MPVKISVKPASNKKLRVARPKPVVYETSDDVNQIVVEQIRKNGYSRKDDPLIRNVEGLFRTYGKKWF